MSNIRKNFMRKLFFLLVVFIGFAILVNQQVFAQNADDDVHDTIKMWILYKLKKDLGLSAEQSVVILSKIEKLEERKRKLFKDEQQILKKFIIMIKNDVDNEKEYSKLLTQYDKIQDDYVDFKKSTHKEMAKMLNPIQRAKLLIIMKKLHRKIRNIVNMLEKRERRGRGRGMRKNFSNSNRNKNIPPPNSPPDPTQETF